MHGILLIDKPYGYSAFQTVSTVKQLLRVSKVGHGGTLDPLATGMLPVCLGESRKFAHHILDADKCYTVCAHFGRKTTTLDMEGACIAEDNGHTVSREYIESAIQNFIGEITQVPPAYSALKYAGKPLYYYARKGVEVVKAARTITIRSFQLLHWRDNVLTAQVVCSKGTYIRSLLDDLAQAVGYVGGTLIDLRRDWVIPFQQKPIVSVEQLAYYCQYNDVQDHGAYQSLSDLFKQYRSYHLQVLEAKRIAQGQHIFIALDEHPVGEAVLFVEGHFLGLGDIAINGQLSAKRLRASVIAWLDGVTIDR